MATVFISYTHEDVKLAEKLESTLKDKGYEVWRDLTTKDLAVGRYIPDGVASGLERADYLALIITENSLKSRWMQQEMFSFIMNDQKWENVLPLKFDSTEPKSFHPILQAALYADFSDFEAGIERVIERLGSPSSMDKRHEHDRERLYFAIELAIRAGAEAMMHYNSSLISNMTLDDRKNAATLADRSAQNIVVRAIRNNDSYYSERIVGEEGEYKTLPIDEDGFTWVVDPLDGTLNFENRIPFFCSAIGVLEKGKPVIGVIYNPVEDEVYYSGYGSLTRVWDRRKGEVSVVRSAESTKLKECAVGIHISSRDEIAAKLVDSGLLMKMRKKARTLRGLGCGQLALAYVASGRLNAFFQFDAPLWDQVAGLVLVQNSSGGKISRIPSGKKWNASTGDFCASANRQIDKAMLKVIKTTLKKSNKSKARKK